MTDFTKPDTATADTAADEPASDDYPCKDHPDGCPCDDHKGYPPVGSKKWFWSMRIQHAPLFVAPMLPLFTTIRVLADPGLTSTKLAEKVGHGSLPEGVEVRQVTVELTHATIIERMILAVPSLMFAVALAAVCYALWRIEINFAAGRRVFTDKDKQWLGRSVGVVGTAWLVGLVIDLGYPFWLQHKYHVIGATPDFSGMSLGIVALIVVLACFSGAYKRAHAHYQELENAV